MDTLLLFAGKETETDFTVILPTPNFPFVSTIDCIAVLELLALYTADNAKFPLAPPRLISALGYVLLVGVPELLIENLAVGFSNSFGCSIFEILLVAIPFSAWLSDYVFKYKIDTVAVTVPVIVALKPILATVPCKKKSLIL